MKNIKALQDKWKPRSKTGKTKFNREKARGESWTDLRKEEWEFDKSWAKQPWVK